MISDALERYTRARDEAAAALDGLRAALARHDDRPDAGSDRAALSAADERLRNGRFVLAVVGEFSSGKFANF